FFLLRFGAEKQQWLRNTDRLVGRNERSQIFVPASEQHRSPAIVDLRQAEPVVLFRNFDAECAQREQLINVLLRNFAGAIDLVSIHVLAQILFQIGEKFVSSLAILGALLRQWINPIVVISP